MTPQPPDPRLASIRRRLVYVLFSGAVLGWTAFVATLTVATVAARSLTGSTVIAGFPLAAGALGQALGTNLLGRLSARRGRRFIMLLGPPVSALGATVELVGVVFGRYWLLVGGAVLVGGGIGAIHLTRYAAAELAEEHRRGRAVGILVWSGTIGSLVGANLADGMGRVTEDWLGTPYGGAFLLAVIAFLLCWLLFLTALRPDPSRVAVTARQATTAAGSAAPALRLPAVQLSILALLSAQGAMVLVMTATPLRIEDAGYGLDRVGLVLSVHALGMFAFAPLVGRLVDRIGHLSSLGIGAVVTWTSLVLSGTAPDESTWLLGAGLFLLGLGWSFSFVAGSSMLFASSPPQVRQVVEGWADSAIWTMVMLGSLSAGVLMGAIGYALLNLVAAGPALVILLVVLSTPRLRAALSR
ncbi:MAG: MFS transporter [bacterium]|nr:MFS transporter [bacterium]MDE0288694.1 MFS transporter [bacterium]MDE0437986.1 MFS transporter [bacterium]